MKLNSLLLLAIATLLGSCARIYYEPNSANIPQLKKKGEVIATGYSGYAVESNLYGISSAYAITKNIGVMLNATHYSGTTVTLDNGETAIANPSIGYNPKNFSSMAEVGIGFFKPFATDSILIFETYIGYGKYFSNKAFCESQSISFNLNRTFFQPSFGVRLKWLETSYGIRVTKLFIGKSKPSVDFANDLFSMSEFEGWNGRIDYDQVFTVRVGTNKIKVQGQIINPSQAFSFNIDEVNLSNITLGVQIRF
jgi:hypothetical protein